MMGLPRPWEIHCAVGSSRGSPARYTARSVDRSCRRSSAASWRLSTRTAVGAENRVLTPKRSTSCHRMAPSGRTGVPSYRMVVWPPISGP
ncbi:Uncharacterised protein [Bordetella pertussis]|nr:Uncharacterised protein [Bordetella pertussis]CFW37653.1 Uncharacterised protein [Bordetella pertussis]